MKARVDLSCLCSQTDQVLSSDCWSPCSRSWSSRFLSLLMGSLGQWVGIWRHVICLCPAVSQARVGVTANPQATAHADTVPSPAAVAPSPPRLGTRPLSFSGRERVWVQETFLGAGPLVGMGAAPLPGEGSGPAAAAALELLGFASPCGHRKFGVKKASLSYASLSAWLVWASWEDTNLTRCEMHNFPMNRWPVSGGQWPWAGHVPSPRRPHVRRPPCSRGLGPLVTRLSPPRKC